MFVGMPEQLAARMSIASLNTRGIPILGSQLAGRYAAIGTVFEAGPVEVACFQEVLTTAQGAARQPGHRLHAVCLQCGLSAPVAAGQETLPGKPSPEQWKTCRETAGQPRSTGKVSGAGAPVQLSPASSVRATDVQNSVAQCPGVPTCPITQPVSVPTKVTEEGRKAAGTGSGVAGEGTGKLGRDTADDSPMPPPVRVETEAGCPASALVAGGLSTVKFITCGTVIAAVTITAADPSVTASLRCLRRRARRLIRSKEPGGG